MSQRILVSIASKKNMYHSLILQTICGSHPCCRQQYQINQIRKVVWNGTHQRIEIHLHQELLEFATTRYRARLINNWGGAA